MQMEGFRALSGESQEKELCSLVEFFKMLGNSTRIHILLLLMEGECVGNCAESAQCSILSARPRHAMITEWFPNVRKSSPVRLIFRRVYL